MRIYLVRHGRTVLNEKSCYYGRLDPELDETGVYQAKKFREYFKSIHIDYVISSPLRRAKDTAHIIAEDGDERNICTDEMLCEQAFGVFEGLSYDEIMDQYPEVMENWNRDYDHYRIPGGESFEDVRKRADRFLDSIKTMDGTLLIVAHKGTLGHLIASMLNMPLDAYWNFVFEQGCINIIDIEDGYGIIRKLNQDI